MALEYVLCAAADITTEEFVAFLAEALNASVHDNDVRRDGLMVIAYRETPGEEYSPHTIGFTHRVTATFRFSNLAHTRLRDENTVLMVRAVLAFLGRYPGSGVLLFNGERVVLQKLDGPVELDSGWEDWSLDGMAKVIAGLPQHPLPQPLL
jgi:hypothetical protein